MQVSPGSCKANHHAITGSSKLERPRTTPQIGFEAAAKGTVMISRHTAVFKTRSVGDQHPLRRERGSRQDGLHGPHMGISSRVRRMGSGSARRGSNGSSIRQKPSGSMAAARKPHPPVNAPGKCVGGGSMNQRARPARDSGWRSQQLGTRRPSSSRTKHDVLFFFVLFCLLQGGEPRSRSAN